jgi:hypothetical protein
MPKELLNSRITYNNVSGIINNFSNFINQPVLTTSSPTFANLYVSHDTHISGNLYVTGNTAIFNTNILETQDNIILLNSKETSNGVSLNQSGIEIDRGLLENYRVVYDEPSNSLKAGLISTLQKLTFREDSPLIDGIMTWDNLHNRIVSVSDIKLPTTTFSSTVNTINSSTGSLVVDGGVGIQKDLYIGGNIGGSEGVLNFNSNLKLPESNKLYFNTTLSSIYSSIGNIIFDTPFVKIPVVDISGNIASTNTNGNLYFNLINGILLDDSKNIYLGSMNKSISGINNDIQISLLDNSNVKLLQNTGILFNNNSRIYDNGDLNITSNSNINFTSNSLNIPDLIPLNFGTMGSSISSKNNQLNVSGNVTITGDLNVLGSNTLINTQTLLVNDNIFIINDNTIGNLYDSGFLVKESDNLYNGLFYKKSTNEFTFAYTNTQSSTNVVISDYLSVRCRSLTLTDTTDSTGQNTGSLIIPGGVSIAKSLYTDTIIVNNLQSGNFFGNNLNVINASMGNLNISGMTTLINTIGTVLLVKGDAQFNSIVNINKLVNTDSSIGNLSVTNVSASNLNVINENITGQLNANNITFLNNSAYFEKSNYMGWLYLGILTDNSNTFIKLENKNSTETINININSGIPILTYQYQNSKQNDIYVYLDNNIIKLYIYNYNNDTTIIDIKTTTTTLLSLIQEGNGVNPSSFNNWTLLDSSYKPSNTNINAGNSNINGTLKVNDNLPVFANNSISTKNIGILLARYQTENDIGIGDVISDSVYYIDVLPSQTVITTQLQLSTNSDNTNDIYTGFYIKFNNQIRKIVNYSGGTRLVTVNTPWTTQPIIGDNVYFYRNKYASLQYSEQDKTMLMGYTNNNDIIGLLDLKVKNINLSKLTSLNGILINSTENTTNITSGSIVTYGGVSILKDLNINKNVIIGYNDGNTSSNLYINNNENNITLNGNVSTLNFNSTNTSFNINNDNNLFELGNNNINISDNGNIGINTTTNINADLTLRSNGIININDTIGALKLLGGNDLINSNFIEIGQTINILGLVNFMTTNSSNNSSTGSIVTFGGVSINNTTNSTGFTSGGALTLAGGLSVAKDTYINGDLHISGTIVGNSVSFPTLTFYPTVNCVISLYGNAILTKVSNLNELSFYVQVIPTLDSKNTEFEFDLPNLNNNLTTRFDIISYASGYTDDTNVIVLFNILSFGKVSSKRGVVKFQSNTNTVHYIQIICKYNG